MGCGCKKNKTVNTTQTTQTVTQTTLNETPQNINMGLVSQDNTQTSEQNLVDKILDKLKSS